MYEQVNILLDSIKKAGDDAVVIIKDGNKVNQKFFSLFDTVNTQSWLTKTVFLIFDYVHLLKNIRNNWLQRKHKDLNMLQMV